MESRRTGLQRYPTRWQSPVSDHNPIIDARCVSHLITAILSIEQAYPMIYLSELSPV
jgi:hypothetical protein